MFMLLKRSRRPKKYWTKEETSTLKLAVSKYGKKWCVIEKMYPIFKKNNRTQVDIKDKWRNLNRKKSIKSIKYKNIEKDNDYGDNEFTFNKTEKSPVRRKIGSVRRKSPERRKIGSVRRKSPINEPEYIIYSKEGCPYCNNAKNLLKSNKKSFKEIKITDKNIQKIYTEIDKKTKCYRYFPIIFKKNKFIGGFEELKNIKL